MRSPTNDILEIALTSISRVREYTPRFNLVIGWASSYDQLFSSNFDSECTEDRLLSEIANHSRVLIVGTGGGAKTALLSRLTKSALEHSWVPALLTLKEWSEPDYSEWKLLGESSERMRFLFTRFGLPGLQPRDLDFLSPNCRRLLLVDGINEVDANTGQQIIYALDEYARYAINTAVIATDRLVRREFMNPLRWRLGIVEPLEPSAIKAALAGSKAATDLYEAADPNSKELLKTPYFLDSFLKDPQLGQTRSASMFRFFTKHVLDVADLEAVSIAAFAVYKGASRAFKLEDFEAIAGAKATSDLCGSGIVQQHNGLAFFQHHLKHDYLVSRYLAGDSARWTAEAFKIATFHASSFETTMMAMEQMDDSESADRFLRSLFDWNAYAAGYSISEGREGLVSRWMLLVILAMFAERRWDNVTATGEKAADTLGLIKSQDAREFESASSIEDIFRILRRNQDGPAWFQTWLSVYARPAHSDVEPEIVDELTNLDSVLGWTVSNVLRRSSPSEDMLLAIRSLLTDTSATIRWRAAHVLGAFPSESNRDALLERLSDQDDLVRYGATRSLVEMASRSNPEFCASVFNALSAALTLIVEKPIVLREFERAIFARNPKAPNYGRLVAAVLVRLQDNLSSSEDLDRSRRVLGKLVEIYGV